MGTEIEAQPTCRVFCAPMIKKVLGEARRPNESRADSARPGGGGRQKLEHACFRGVVAHAGQRAPVLRRRDHERCQQPGRESWEVHAVGTKQHAAEMCVARLVEARTQPVETSAKTAAALTPRPVADRRSGSRRWGTTTRREREPEYAAVATTTCAPFAASMRSGRATRARRPASYAGSHGVRPLAVDLVHGRFRGRRSASRRRRAGTPRTASAQLSRHAGSVLASNRRCGCPAGAALRGGTGSRPSRG